MNVSAKDKYIEFLERIALCLRTNNPNAKIAYRERERSSIINFLLSSIAPDPKAEPNKCMIMFGQPGLGKTILLNEVLDNLMSPVKEKYINDALSNHEFDIAAVDKKAWRTYFCNATKFVAVADLLRDICLKVFKVKNLEKYENSDYFLKVIRDELRVFLDTHYLVIMIDELEYLLHNDKRDFKNIIDLLDMRKTGFIKFAISNTLNIMTEVAGRKERLSPEYLVFKPYTRDSLKGILLHRVETVFAEYDISMKTVLPDSVMNYVVTNVVNKYSSDVRTLLSLFAGVISNKLQCLYKFAGADGEVSVDDIAVTIPDVTSYMAKNALKETIELIKRLGILPQLLLLAICICMKGKGHIIKFADIRNKYDSLLKIYEISNSEDIMPQIDVLKNYNLIIMDKKDSDVIKMDLTHQELDFCLVEIEEFEDYHHKIEQMNSKLL